MTEQLTYDVRVWANRVRKGKSGPAYQVRWSVDGLARSETFATRKLADSFRASLLSELRSGTAFDPVSGLPASVAMRRKRVSWHEVAVSFADMKWPSSSARHRKSIAEALVSIAFGMTDGASWSGDARDARAALLHWSFNAIARGGDPSDDQAQIHRWFLDNSLDIAKAAEPARLRQVLHVLATKLDGSPAAQTTFARKRGILFGVLQHAVELGHLPNNPLTVLRWNAPRADGEVDRRVVVNPEQAARLLKAVREVDPALEAFFGCLYFAALRPSEARHLRIAHLTLPAQGWGELLLTGSSQRLSSEWGGGDHQALKHRAVTATRRVPACPELVALLRDHVDTFGTAPCGRLFVVRVGQARRPVTGPYARPVSSATYANVWRRARQAAMSPEEFASPMARRPYDLRHAAVSLWLNAGVSAPQVAEWAGHSVNVLLKVYASCVDGQDVEDRRRVEAALRAMEQAPSIRDSCPPLVHKPPSIPADGR